MRGGSRNLKIARLFPPNPRKYVRKLILQWKSIYESPIVSLFYSLIINHFLLHLCMEVWKPIIGYESEYEVSSQGRFRSFPKHSHKSVRIYLGNKDSRGYRRVVLCRNGEEHTFYAHRLVAIHFIDNPNNFPYINHKNQDKSDNRVENLEWCDAKYNINYGDALERAKETSLSRHRATAKKHIAQYTLDGTFVKEYSSIKEANLSLGKKASATSISRAVNGIIPHAYGFKWYPV